MKFLKNIPSVVLGLIFVIFSVQFFVFIFMQYPMPEMNEMALQFNSILAASGYIWVVKVLELVLGILIIIPRTRKLALVLIAPIVVNILLSEFLIIRPPLVQTAPALLVGILTIVGLYQHRAAYLPMIRK